MSSSLHVPEALRPDMPSMPQHVSGSGKARMRISSVLEACGVVRYADLAALTGMLQHTTKQDCRLAHKAPDHTSMRLMQDYKTGKQVEKDLWVTRKGATSAQAGQLGLIPGSMGVGCGRPPLPFSPSPQEPCLTPQCRCTPPLTSPWLRTSMAALYLHFRDAK